ncbi:Type 1 glutamine amidotransferase-like domain-containing protein [Gordonia zhaorongruii]|uniref:Type 1 glutamine amidotransferase-like domain-containing protein n=1 Tax=Gordonia zhaorongruii TaxID=2597659 RepID=UPI00104F4619|nr:Type 1 glutamine amidotransferase-like domain-containing protein [Gordonia zhaorongruii]
MHLLLLSLGAGAVPRFVAESVRRPVHEVTVGVVDGAGGELLSDLGYHVVDTPAHGRRVHEFAESLDSVDAVFVGGGNTFSVLETLRASGADAILDARVRDGLPYIGLSAGSVIAGPDIGPAGLMDDPSEAPELASTRGFGWIDSVPIPHAGGMLPSYPPDLIATTMSTFGARFELLALDDDQALLVESGAQRVVPSR